MAEEIEIHQTIYGVGFAAKPEERSMQGFEFDNGKIAYADPDDVIRAADSEKLLVKALMKETRCIDAAVVRRGRRWKGIQDVPTTRVRRTTRLPRS